MRQPSDEVPDTGCDGNQTDARAVQTWPCMRSMRGIAASDPSPCTLRAAAWFTIAVSLALSALDVSTAKRGSHFGASVGSGSNRADKVLASSRASCTPN